MYHLQNHLLSTCLAVSFSKRNVRRGKSNRKQHQNNTLLTRSCIILERKNHAPTKARNTSSAASCICVQYEGRYVLEFPVLTNNGARAAPCLERAIPDGAPKKRTTRYQSEFRKAINARRSALANRRKPSREACASPPCHSIASSRFLARPS